MKHYQVKFFDDGGHSAAKGAVDKLGIVHTISSDRYQEISTDGPDKLRSPYEDKQSA